MNYHFSKDYNLFWELARKQEVIYAHGGFIGLTASINNDNGIGLGPCWFYSEQAFIKHCEYYEIQFLIPGEVEELVGALKEIYKEAYNGNDVRVTEMAKELLKKYEVKNG